MLEIPWLRRWRGPAERDRTLRLLALFWLCPFAAIHAEIRMDGSAIVTSHSGSIRAQQAGGQTVEIDLHSVLQPSGTRFSTRDDSQLFLALSNGIALGLDENSTLQCIQFSQRAFTDEGLEEGREPSVSRLLLQLDAGRIAVASDQMSPLSELRIGLPFGSVRLHRGTCLIEYDATGLRLTAFEGNLTYYYPDSDAREFISTSKQVRISQQSSQLQQVAEIKTSGALQSEAILLCQAAQHSSRRVIFQPNQDKDKSKAPKPVLIVSPDYFEQPTPRPGRFKGSQ